MSRQSLQDQAQPVKRDAVVPLATRRGRQRDPSARPARRFLVGWAVPSVGVCKAFVVGDRIEWRTPPLDAVGRAAWAGYRGELERQARARVSA